jgi:hypothetical protein
VVTQPHHEASKISKFHEDNSRRRRNRNGWRYAPKTTSCNFEGLEASW